MSQERLVAGTSEEEVIRKRMSKIYFLLSNVVRLFSSGLLVRNALVKLLESEDLPASTIGAASTSYSHIVALALTPLSSSYSTVHSKGTHSQAFIFGNHPHDVFFHPSQRGHAIHTIANTVESTKGQLRQHTQQLSISLARRILQHCTVLHGTGS